MVFSSITFLFYFLPPFLLLYFLFPDKAKNYILLIGSLIFYFWGAQMHTLIMLGCVLLNYVSALLIYRFRTRKIVKNTVFIATLTLVFSLLIYFKYIDFLINSVNGILGTGFDTLGVLLPVGISFYIFQTVSYTVDVYRGDILPRKNPFTFATYVTMFPQLVAGPIVRYKDIDSYMDKRCVSFDRVSRGISRFVIGLAKKVILANTLAELCANIRADDEKTVLLYWIWAVAFTLNIYFDFSGYSDMAIGLGSIMGFEFMENFQYPFIAKSVTEFFRRWHISLGVWFRDYVYIPLGGNRKGVVRQIFNLLVVWLLTGLWHGAAWNFVLWGLYYAILLIIEKLFLLRALQKVPAVVGHVYTVITAVLGFVIFDTVSIKEIGVRFAGMLGFGTDGFSSSATQYTLTSYLLLIVIAVIASTPVLKNIKNRIEKRQRIGVVISFLEPILVLGLFVLSVGFLVDASFNPFIYFRF